MLEVIHDLTPIFVKPSEVPTTKTRQKFISDFLKSKVTSYKNLTCTDVQCNNGRYRSITEVHQMTLSRFPKTSFDAIIRIVKTLIDEDAAFRMSYCSTINKVVLRYTDGPSKTYMSDSTRRDYYTKVGVDGYSLKQYEEVINKLN